MAIFRTPNGCGWGVKTMELIEKNHLVTEYVGEAITQEEAEERGRIYDSCGQTYLFDLDFNEGECLYTLDAKKYGNISHFINHSVRVVFWKFCKKLLHRQSGHAASHSHNLGCIKLFYSIICNTSTKYFLQDPSNNNVYIHVACRSGRVL